MRLRSRTLRARCPSRQWRSSRASGSATSTHASCSRNGTIDASGARSEPQASEVQIPEKGTEMNEKEVFETVVKILTPHAKNQAALASVGMDTNILDDLKVNSARLVDVVLAFEDAFDVEIADEEVDNVNTVGDCVRLVIAKAS